MSERSEQRTQLEGSLGGPLYQTARDLAHGLEGRKLCQVDQDGNVTGVNLCYASLVDVSFLEELTALTSLDLSDNKLLDVSFLKELRGLTSLGLSGNEITDVSVLKELGGLTSLDVSFNKLTDVSVLKELGGLTSLDLSFNEITDVSFLKELTGLTSLVLSGNKVTDWSFLKELTGLTSLGLYDSGVTDVSFLKELTGLTSLVLGGCAVTDWSFLNELRGLTSLGLRAQELTDVSFLKELTGLTSLDLSFNELTDVSVLKELAGLTILDLWGNEVTDVSFLSELTELTSLGVSGNAVTDWSFLKELRGLTSLGVSGYELTDVSFLKELTGLTSLVLTRTGITDWSFLKELRSLTSLDLSDNQLVDVSFLKELTGLTSLDLSFNRIRDLSGMVSLTRLHSFSAFRNQIAELPRALIERGVEIELGGQLPTRGFGGRTFTIGANPLEVPPLEIVERGHPAIVSWFDALGAQDEELSEVKVVLVGDGGSGKTSLRKRLMKQAPDPEESQTLGIEILDWSVKARGREVLVHFWDFGGQVINHATHQFFLSRRSLYILVLDGRKDEDPEYWLKHIESFGGDSKVLIVLNKMDENPGFDVNRPALKEKYPGIREFFKVACLWKSNSGIPALKKALLSELAEVELASTRWPRSWFNVKSGLESIEEPFIEYARFERLCAEQGIVDAVDQGNLIGYLNDLGIAIHFADPRLTTTQVLDPRWVTQAVYRIINAPELADSYGVLKLKSLDSILKKTDKHHYVYSADKHGYIVDLMKKFELCYELDTGRILVPDLLPVREPNFDWPDGELLRFHFEYDFLPQSVMPRFIVNEHADIDQGLQWRTGVVLKDGESGARALVRSDSRNRRIAIEVRGERRREYFNSIRRTFRRVHDSFTKLDVARKVPLPDESEYVVDYEDLLYHEDMGRSTILVGELRREYSVRLLLDGIETSEARAQARRSSSELAPEKKQSRREGPVTNITVNIGDGVKFSGDVGIGHKIADSFNKARGLDQSSEVKPILEALAKEVAAIAEQLPSTDAAEAAADLEMLTNEVAKSEPLRKYWEVSLDGVKAAATAVGAVGATAVQLVEKLRPLIGG